MVALIFDTISSEVKNFFRNIYWRDQMNVNPSDLLPTQPNHTYGPKLTFLGLIKNCLICLVVLGGIFLVVDELTNFHTAKMEKNAVIKAECEDITEQLEFKKFTEKILNVEKEILNGNNLGLIKKDISELKDQVMYIWNNMNSLSPSCEIPEIENKIRNAVLNSGVIDSKIKKALDTYDADKLALYDYAADYAGGEVVATPDTTPYPACRIMGFYGLFKMTSSSSPNEMIKPSTIPGDCFRFYGSKGRIILKLGKKIHVGSVTMEHSPLVEDYSDAPKDFRVFGLTDPEAEGDKKILLGAYTYKVHERESSITNFPIISSIFFNDNYDHVELEILSNYGNPKYTSIYRFRVHAAKSKE